MTLAYIALGANLGDPVANVRAALDALDAIPGTHLKAVSSLYRTEPVGLKEQPDFINAVAVLETEQSPQPMLTALFEIERKFGRQRSVPNAARTLDLDLLMHGDAVSDDPALTLPHPRMCHRSFVLKPLAEVAPGVEIPGHGKVESLLAQCHCQRVERVA